jgi:succinate dehydrogenase / fumarate reductase cytochrome b subunit
LDSITAQEENIAKFCEGIRLAQLTLPHASRPCAAGFAPPLYSTVPAPGWSAIRFDMTEGYNMAEAIKKPRPEFRNIGLGQILTAYRLPLAGRVSILHRVSGALLFVFLPFLLYLFDQSLTSELSFEGFKIFLSNIVVKIVTLVLAWAFLFHFCAGVRHLLMDTNHESVSKENGKRTSIVVFVVSSVLTIAFALKLFGAF